MNQIPRILGNVFDQGVNIARHVSFNGVHKKIDRTFTMLEQGLNIAGYIPFLGISTVSGAIRIEFGKTLILGSIACAALVAIGSLFSRDAGARVQGLQFASTIARKYTLHGLSNMGRGLVEMVPYFGLVACLPYDVLSNRHKYPTEVAGRWEYVTQA